MSSTSGRGFRFEDNATGLRFRIRSRSRLPIPTAHRLSLEDLNVIGSLGSGPWYGNSRRRLRGGPFGMSGGGVSAVTRCVEGSQIDMMRAL